MCLSLFHYLPISSNLRTVCACYSKFQYISLSPFHYLSIASLLWSICSCFIINATVGEEPPVSAVPAEVLQEEHAEAPPGLAREGKGTINQQTFSSLNLVLMFSTFLSDHNNIYFERNKISHLNTWPLYLPKT